MLKDFNYFPISPLNCITFNKETFDLSSFYKGLSSFYNTVSLDNNIYYAHPFNGEGLFHNPTPVNGFKVNKLDDNSSFFSYLSDNDITFATDMENNKLNNFYNSVYKYNILFLYHSILESFEGHNTYNPLFYNKKIENGEFYLFISKNCINIPEFDLFKTEFFKKYKFRK